MLRDSLLTLHVFSVIVWLGCGIYERFLTVEISRAKGTSMEVPLLKIYGRYAGVIAIATILVALFGVLMSWLLGWGFFNTSHLWLTIKQGIMLAILLDMVYMLPVFIKGGKLIQNLPEEGGNMLKEVHALLGRIDRHVVPMRVGASIAVVLAIFRP